jgi:hypothetical protein
MDENSLLMLISKLQPKEKMNTKIHQYPGDNEILISLEIQDTNPNSWNRGRDIIFSLTF